MERKNINALVDTAPATLKRSGHASLSQPNLFLDVEGFDSFETLKKPDTLQLVDKIKNLASKGKIKAWNVPAKEVLSTAIEVPKIVPSNFHNYFTDTDRITRMLEKYVLEQRYGRDGFRESWKLNDHPSSRFHSLSESWRKASCSNDNALWEVGIIIEGIDSVNAISVSYPWDQLSLPFYKRLTPSPIFVGREKELNMFSQMISGRNKKDLEIASAFSSNDLEVWWGQAQGANNVIRGSNRETEIKMRPYFEDRILAKLQTQISNKSFHQAVQNSDRITGYFVTAQRSTFPGAVDLTLHMDERNWLEERPPRIKKVPKMGSYEFKDQHKPPEETMWVSAMGGIHNDRYYNDPNQDFSVYISLQRDNDEQIEGISMQVCQHLRLNENNKRTKMFYINNSEFGDGVTYSKYTPIKKDIQPMSEIDYRKVLEIFNAAKKRAVVDSSTYWDSGKKRGLSRETQMILKMAETTLKQKIKENENNK